MAGEVEIERLLVRLVGDATSYQRMLRDAQTQATRANTSITKSFQRMAASVARSLRLAGASLTKFGRGMQRMGRAMALRLTAPIVLGFGASIKAFADFDKAMIESTSIMKVTAEQTERMTELALDLGTKGIKGPKDIAQAYFFLASAGKNAEQSMALLPPLLNFATAGAFDLALATDLLTDAQSALGLASANVQEDMRNMTKLADILVGANTLANASVQQFSTALTTKAGSAIKAYNIDLEDGVALLAAYADQGIKAELAGNALDRVVRLLTKAQAQNSQVFEKFNVNVFNAQGEFNTFANIIGDLERATEGMSTKMKAATLTALGFEARIQGVILPLLGSSQAIARYREELEKMGGISESVATKQLKAFTNQMIIVKNQIVSVAIDIGKILSPTIIAITDRIKEWVKQWKALRPQLQETIVRILALAAAIGPALIIFGTLTIFIGAVVTALGALSLPLLVAVAAFAALSAGITFVASKLVSMERLKAIWDGAIDGGKRFLSQSIEFISNFRENVAITVTWLRGVWGTITENLGKIFTTALNNLKNNFFVFIRALTAGFGGLWAFAIKELTLFFSITLPNLITIAIIKLIPAIVDLVKLIGQGIKTAFVGGGGLEGRLALLGSQLASALIGGMQEGVEASDPFEAFENARLDELEKIEAQGGGFRGIFEGLDLDFSFPQLFGERERELEEARKFGERLGELINKGRNIVLGQTDLQQRIDEERAIFETPIEDFIKDVPPLVIPVQFTTAKFVKFGSFEDLADLAQADLNAANLELDVAVDNNIPERKDEKQDPVFWLQQIVISLKTLIEATQEEKRLEQLFEANLEVPVG